MQGKQTGGEMNENGEHMSLFKEKMQSNPPRLVVLFRYGENGDEQFQWGIVGDIRLMTLIGSIISAQWWLESIVAQLGTSIEDECDESAFVIIFDGDTDPDPLYFIHPDIPIISIIGMLEVIKGAIVNGRIAQQAAAQQTQILGPDGNPMTNRIKGI